MTENAKLIIEGKTYELPIIVGTENEKAIDISSLRKDSGYITLDNGYANTGACKSAITFLDGEKGILRYRGIPIEEIAEKSTFVEASYLLIYGELPTARQLKKFSESFTLNAAIHDDMKKLFEGYPPTGHPMGILSAMVTFLGAYYPELVKPEPSKEEIDLIAVELMAKVRNHLRVFI
jgi:citrate synthase